jgi:hypothetical protein
LQAVVKLLDFQVSNNLSNYIKKIEFILRDGDTGSEQVLAVVVPNVTANTGNIDDLLMNNRVAYTGAPGETVAPFNTSTRVRVSGAISNYARAGVGLGIGIEMVTRVTMRWVIAQIGGQYVNASTLYFSRNSPFVLIQWAGVLNYQLKGYNKCQSTV